MIEEEKDKQTSKHPMLCGTVANSTMSSTSNVSTVTTTEPYMAGWVAIDIKGFRIQKIPHPFVPEAIYCNSIDRVTLVKWKDGSETKVTSDLQDNFTPEAGFFAALAIKTFGNDKKHFKDFWLPIISRRIFLDGKKVTPLKYGRWEKERKEQLAKKKAKKEKLNAKVKGKV